LRAHSHAQWVPWGVAPPGDSIQAEKRFSKIFQGWQKGGLTGNLVPSEDVVSYGKKRK